MWGCVVSRAFHIGDLLTITTGRLLCPVGNLYAVLGYMTGDQGVMTHQLALAMDAVRPDVLAQHPWAGEVQPPGEFRDEAHVLAFVAEMAAKYGGWHELTPAPQSWGTHDPLADFGRLFPGVPVIPVVVDEDGAS